MTVEVLAEEEGEPESWPTLNVALAIQAYPPVPLAAVWQRIEAWIDRRWPERPVVYIVRGPGEWRPRLQPFSADTVERWADNVFTAVNDTLPSPLGGYVLGEGIFRFTGTAGDGCTPPDAVMEAARRLAEYFASIKADPGGLAGFTSETLADYSRSGRPSAWAARAMTLSGAADLRRPWRALR